MGDGGRGETHHAASAVSPPQKHWERNLFKETLKIKTVQRGEKGSHDVKFTEPVSSDKKCLYPVGELSFTEPVNRGLNEPQIYTVLCLTNHWRLHHCSVEWTVRIWKWAQCGASTDLLKQQRRKLFKMDLQYFSHSTSLPFVLLIVRDRMKNEVVTIGGIWRPWRCLVGYEILKLQLCLYYFFFLPVHNLLFHKLPNKNVWIKIFMAQVETP